MATTPNRRSSAHKKLDEQPAHRSRTVYLKGEATKVAVYQRSDLRVGQVLQGPLIVEERETTAFVLPGWTLALHPDGSMIANQSKGA